MDCNCTVLYCRLDAAYAPACHYVQQFPSHTIASVARFVAFVAGSFTALFLLVGGSWSVWSSHAWSVSSDKLLSDKLQTVHTVTNC